MTMGTQEMEGHMTVGSWGMARRVMTMGTRGRAWMVIWPWEPGEGHGWSYGHGNPGRGMDGHMAMGTWGRAWMVI